MILLVVKEHCLVAEMDFSLALAHSCGFSSPIAGGAGVEAD